MKNIASFLYQATPIIKPNRGFAQKIFYPGSGSNLPYLEVFFLQIIDQITVKVLMEENKPIIFPPCSHFFLGYPFKHCIQNHS